MVESFSIDDIEAPLDDVNKASDDVPGDEGNRRIHARRMAYWSVNYQNLAGRWSKAKTDNVSAGGLQIITNTAFKSGTKLFIKMPLVYSEYQRTIEAIVETRYSVASKDGFKIGMVFTRISDDDKEFLRLYSEKEI
jgi:hypothetical protein